MKNSVKNVWRRLANGPEQRVAALLYHHVGFPSPGTGHLGLTVAPAEFERQARWLRLRGYTAITPSEWLAWRDTGKDLPEKPVMFTFDDGYADIGVYALPALERCGFRSAIFVITQKTGGAAAWDDLPLMTMDQIRYWAGRGVEIGAHTRTHPRLAGLSAEDTAVEIGGSRRDLEDAGIAPLAFAYPYGCYDDRMRECAGSFFAAAFTCDEGMNGRETDPLLLKRTIVQPDDTLLDVEYRAAFGRGLPGQLRFRSKVKTDSGSGIPQAVRRTSGKPAAANKVRNSSSV
jgi:peptidoglycan/xylan/chitin deacetylase (PgdA/CDA1 family)